MCLRDRSFHSTNSGKLVLKNMSSVESQYNNVDDVELPVKKGYNSFDSLIVTGKGNVTATFTADGRTPSTPSGEGTVLLAGLTNATQAYKNTDEITAKLYKENTSISLGTATIAITKGGVDAKADFTVDVYKRQIGDRTGAVSRCGSDIENMTAALPPHDW